MTRTKIRGKGKTHVFPYTSIEPILKVDSEGNIEVTPLKPTRDLTPLKDVDNGKIVELLKSIRTGGSMRRFEERVGDIQDEIRIQTKNVIDAISQIRIDGDFKPCLLEMEKMNESQSIIMDRLNFLSAKNSENAQLEQGFQTLIGEMKTYSGYMNTLKDIGESVDKLQSMSVEFSNSVREFVAGDRTADIMDSLEMKYRDLKTILEDLSRRGVQTEDQIRSIERGMLEMKETVVARLDTLEDVNREILREVSQFSTCSRMLEEIKNSVSSTEDPVRHEELLTGVQAISREISLIPKIDQGELLETVRGIVMEIGKGDMGDIMKRIDSLQSIVETQIGSLNDMKKALDLQVERSNEMQRALNVSSRLTVIEEGLKILTNRPSFDENNILGAISNLKESISFQPLLNRIDDLERTLAGREEIRRGFDLLERSSSSHDVKLSGIESGLRTIQNLSENSFETQLSILSRIEMKLSEGSGDSDRILEYQRKLKQCEEEKNIFEKKIGSLTMEIETLRSGTTEREKTMAGEELEREKLEQRGRELTAELESLQQKNSDLERELQTVKKDKSIIEPRISQLEEELSKLNQERVLAGELEEEVDTLRERLRKFTDLENEKKKIEAELETVIRDREELKKTLEERERKLESALRDSSEYKKRIDELVSELESSKNQLRRYEEEHLSYISLIGKIDEVILKNEIFSDKVDYVDRLEDIVNEMLRRIEAAGIPKEGEEDEKEKKEVIITDIPRYAVYPSMDKILELLRDPKSDPRVITEEFKLTKTKAERRLLNYFQQTELTRGAIKTISQTSDFIHGMRNLILANPDYINKVETASKRTSPLIASEVESLERPIDLSKAMIGMFVLTNAFSPVLGISSGVDKVEDLAPRVASVLYRVFYINDVIDIVSTLDNRPRNIALENELREELSSTGRWSSDRSYIVMDMEDLYHAVIKVLSLIRDYVKKLTYITEDYAYGLEMRFIILDSFMKCFEESRVELERISSLYAGRETLPEPSTTSILSYVKIRGDNNDIDPRFVFKVDDSRRKILMGHQPYVFSSSFAGDIESSSSYQNDLFGPLTRVFTPDESNEEIGGNLTEMVEELNSGRDICVLALGPSGAGKTSTLLYFRGNQNLNIPPQTGAIPSMLSKLSSEFVSAKVKAVEMTSSYVKGAGPSSYWKEYEVFEGSVNFSRSSSSGDWMSSKDVTINVMNFDMLKRQRGVCEFSKPFEQMSSTERVSVNYGKVSLADFLAKLIDLRLNCGTPNNPDSSRTHLFVFVQLRNVTGSKSPYLIISDLAGREKSFRCDSEAILEIIAMNPRYPELNSLIQNPVKGGLRKSTKRDIPTGEQLKDKAAERVFMGVVNSFAELDRDNLEPAINDGYMKVFFGKPLDWYYSAPAPSGKRVLNKELYKHIQTISQFIVQDDYFLKKILQKFDEMDRQPILMRQILEKIGSPEKIRIYDGILKYYSTMNYTDPNITAQSPGERIRLRVKGLIDVDNAQKEYRGVVDYLDLVILVNAVDLMIFGRPKQVCEVRNVEGNFINQSLDEYSRLVTTASSIDTNYGPLVHPECLPVVCKFAGLDCLLPKNVDKTIPQSAISRVLSRGMGTPSFRPGTLFSVFLVVNASRTEPDKRARPLYDPMDILLERILASARGIEQKSFYVYQQNENLLPILSDIYMWFAGMDESKSTGILYYYQEEAKVLSEYIARVEYRGADESKMLKREDIERLYGASKSNWDLIRRRVNSILGKMMDPKFPSMDSASRSRFTEIINSVRKLKEDINKKNQDTIPGSLAFVEDLVKRNMQPMICSSQNEEDILPPTSISSWKNILYRE